jgi:hypothetical protein
MGTYRLKSGEIKGENRLKLVKIGENMLNRSKKPISIPKIPQNTPNHP